MVDKKTPNKGMFIGGFIKEVFDEIRQVSWPSRSTTMNLTLMVIMISIAVGVYLGALDYLFTYVMSLII